MTTPTDRALAQAFREIVGDDVEAYVHAPDVFNRAAEIDASNLNEPVSNSYKLPAHAEAVEALPGKWREEADTESVQARNMDWADWVRHRHFMRAATLRGCANALQAALAARPAAVGGVTLTREHAELLAKLCVYELEKVSAIIDEAIARIEGKAVGGELPPEISLFGLPALPGRWTSHDGYMAGWNDYRKAAIAAKRDDRLTREQQAAFNKLAPEKPQPLAVTVSQTNAAVIAGFKAYHDATEGGNLNDIALRAAINAAIKHLTRKENGDE